MPATEMKIEIPNPINEILPPDVRQYPNANHTFVGRHQSVQPCALCLEHNGIFITLKADTALRKCECQPSIHFHCFRRFANTRVQGDELLVPCFGCNGQTKIRSPNDVVLNAYYNISGWDDESLDRLFKKWEEACIKFGNPVADDLHILSQASRLRSEEQKLKQALAEVRETRKTLRLKNGQTRAKLRRAAKCYDQLSLKEQDAIVTRKLVAQLRMPDELST
jgi:hypothetical protein